MPTRSNNANAIPQLPSPGDQNIRRILEEGLLRYVDSTGRARACHPIHGLGTPGGDRPRTRPARVRQDGQDDGGNNQREPDSFIKNMRSQWKLPPSRRTQIVKIPPPSRQKCARPRERERFPDNVADSIRDVVTRCSDGPEKEEFRSKNPPSGHLVPVDETPANDESNRWTVGEAGSQIAEVVAPSLRSYARHTSTPAMASA